MLDDPIQVILLVVACMGKLNIPYLISGSLASSIYGIARATRDVDIVADMKEKDIKNFKENLKDEFYVDEEMIKEAIQHRSSFNIIHLESMFKIDVFILKLDTFSIEEFKRRKKVVINLSPEKTAYIATPEDTILSKLEWFRQGGGISDTQWGDVAGILKVQKSHLDIEYLQHWAHKLHLIDLLKKSFRNAKIEIDKK